jgi:hypothetical protein
MIILIYLKKIIIPLTPQYHLSPAERDSQQPQGLQNKGEMWGECWSNKAIYLKNNTAIILIGPLVDHGL